MATAVANTRILSDFEGTKANIIQIMSVNRVPFLRASPGVGKSAMMKMIADEFNLKLIDLRLAQCDPTDLLGFPSIDKAANKARYVPMDTFPLEGDELPIKTAAVLDKTGKVIKAEIRYSGWLLFLDEFNHADRAVQKASYKLVLDRMVGLYHLHSNVALVCAGNLDTDNAFVEELSTAMKARLVHLGMNVDAPQWCGWGMANGVDHRVTSYIKSKPQKLNDFNPDHDDYTYPCSRTWEMASDICKTIPDLNDHPGALAMLAGTIGVGTAREFINYTSIYINMPTMDQIIASPQGTPVPPEPGTRMALCGSIAHHAKPDTIKSLLEYAERMPPEFQIKCVTEITSRNPELRTHTAISEWAVRNANRIL